MDTSCEILLVADRDPQLAIKAVECEMDTRIIDKAYANVPQ